MYEAQDLLEPLRQQPFRPIVLELSSGDRVEINHPDQLLVGDSAVVVGIGEGKSGAASRFRIVGLDHVRSIEFDATTSSPPSRDENGAG